MSQIDLFVEPGLAETPFVASPVSILPTADVMDTLRATEPICTIILDPWYNKGVGGTRADYHDWLATLIAAACEKRGMSSSGAFRKRWRVRLRRSRRISRCWPG